MKIRVFRSGHGDALLLTSDTGKHILVDGGVPAAYEDHWATTIGKLRDKNQTLELVYVSHIDRDHIGGIVEMFDNEVLWRLYEARTNNPALSQRAKKPKKPKFKRPPEVKAIWHNGFWEKTRKERIRNGHSNSMDMADIFFRGAQIHAGAGGHSSGSHDHGKETTPASLANRMHFLGQSVGDAVELGRRIGGKQLNIPVNPEFDGSFITRKQNQDTFSIGGFNITVLGPTTDELKKMEGYWDTWLNDNQSRLAVLKKRHDRDADKLENANFDISSMAKETSIALSGSQYVSPPNLASIILLAENDGRTILLTGDADDASVIAGLEAKGLLDANQQIHVNVHKIGHHGADNSYSNKLARTVLADDYVFCGDGANTNPETDVVGGYLRVLLEGDNNHPPAIKPGMKPTFWFSSGPGLESKSKLNNHWIDVEIELKKWQGNYPNKFRYKFLKSGDSFIVK